MRATALRSARVAKRMPRPVVNTMQATVPVDLTPAGNTIALTTTSQNPFTDGARVSVSTQLSGGAAPAPREMQSPAIMHRFLPGLGQDANMDKQNTSRVGFTEGVTQVINALVNPTTVAAAQTLLQEREAVYASGDPQQIAAWEQRMAGETRRARITQAAVIGGGIAAVLGLGYLMFGKKRRR